MSPAELLCAQQDLGPVSMEHVTKKKQSFHLSKLWRNCQRANKRASQEWLEPAGPMLLKLSEFYFGTHTVR